MATLEERVTAIEANIQTILNIVQGLGESMSHGFAKVDENFVKVEQRIVSKLQGGSSSTIETVDLKLDDLKEEIKKINTVTGYEGEFKNLQILK